VPVVLGAGLPGDGELVISPKKPADIVEAPVGTVLQKEGRAGKQVVFPRALARVMKLPDSRTPSDRQFASRMGPVPKAGKFQRVNTHVLG